MLPTGIVYKSERNVSSARQSIRSQSAPVLNMKYLNGFLFGYPFIFEHCFKYNDISVLGDKVISRSSSPLSPTPTPSPTCRWLLVGSLDRPPRSCFICYLLQFGTAVRFLRRFLCVLFYFCEQSLLLFIPSSTILAA